MENVATPAKRALAVLDKPPAADVDAPARRISKKVRTAIGYMVNGECKQITEAAAKAGLARETLSRALSQPHVAQHLREKVLRHLAIQAARAGAVKGELLDSDNEMVRDRASTFVLGLADIAPASAPALSAARLSVVPSERHTSARPTSGLSRSGTFLRSHQNCDLSFFRLIGVGIRIVPMV